MSKPWYKLPALYIALLWMLSLLLIWLVGPLVGLDSLLHRIAWTVVVTAILVLLLVIIQMSVARSSSSFDQGLRRDADQALVGASPDKRADVTILRQRLLAALDTLKQSRIGKLSGPAALYELPWYLVIGHPSAGKSSAILQSGLSFPLAARGKAQVPGVGGTRNCDWFFCTEGVLLDTAGRYSSQNEDLPEWLEFMKLLQKYRPQAPVNGVIVTVSITELLKFQTPAFETYARQIRQRLNQLDAIFRLKVPVFLLITKMDLVPGFSDFFEAMTEEERNQSWGAILNHRQFEGFNVPEVAGQHLDLLWEGLTQIGQDRMLSHPSRADRTAFNLFPAEFRSLKGPICAFISLLVEKDPYNSRPLIRGLHFTSALQEGDPAWMLGQRVAGEFALDAYGVRPQVAPVHRSHFLQGFFRHSLFPDQFLIGKQIAHKRSPARTAVLAVGMLLLALLMGLCIFSCVRNRELVEQTMDRSTKSIVFSRQPGLQNQLNSTLILQLTLAPLAELRQDTPLSYRWGLFVGNDLEASVRREYYRRMSALLLVPVKANLEAALRTGIEGDALPVTPILRVERGRGRITIPKPAAPAVPKLDLYNALKTYRMLGDRSRMDAGHLADQLPVFWRPSLLPEGSEEVPAEIHSLVTRLVSFYADQCKDPDFPTITLDDSLAQAACRKLQGEREAMDPLQRAYIDLKSAVGVKCLDLTVQGIVGNEQSDLVKSSYRLPGCFTLVGWATFQEEIDKALDGTLGSTDWVLSCGSGTLAALSGDRAAKREQLVALYKAEFDQQWQRFLEGVELAELRDVATAATVLGRLSEPKTSPIKQILLRAVKETYIDKPGLLDKLATKAKKAGDKTWSSIIGSEADNAPEGSSRPGHRFPGLARLVASPDGSRSLLDGYFDALKKVKERLDVSQGDAAQRTLAQNTMSRSGSPLYEAQQFVDTTLLPQLEEPSRSMVRPMLIRPLTRSMAPAFSGAERDLNAAWTTKVLRPWKDLADKYPFSDSGNDASFSEIQRFLKPGDGPLAQFIEKDLANLVEKKDGRIVPLVWGNQGTQGIRFSAKFIASVNQLLQASEVALREGEASRFDLYPNGITGTTESLLELDGQRLLYKNGQQLWTSFSWPGTGTQGVRVQVISFSGAPATIFNFPGRMGLLRLLEKAEEKHTAQGIELQWKFSVPRNFKGALQRETGDLTEYPQPYRLGFRHASGTDPRLLLRLRRLQLPDRITQ